MNWMLESVITLLIAMVPVAFVLWVFANIPCFRSPDMSWWQWVLYRTTHPSNEERIAYIKKELEEGE